MIRGIFKPKFALCDQIPPINIGDKYMQIKSKKIKGILEAVLYDDDGKQLMILDKKYDQYGNPTEVIVPDWAMEKIKKDAEEEEIDEIELVPEPTPFNNYASLMNRRSMTTPEKKIQYVEHADPKARMKPSPKPTPPKQFASFKTLKHMNEEETDILVQQITDNVLNRLQEREEEVPVKKGFLRMLLGATAMNELLSNRDKEERKRLQEEFDRNYYRRKN